jgi:hypothetical protein
MESGIRVLALYAMTCSNLSLVLSAICYGVRDKSACIQADRYRWNLRLLVLLLATCMLFNRPWPGKCYVSICNVVTGGSSITSLDVVDKLDVMT